MNFDRLAQLVSPVITVLDIGANRGDWHNQARLRWLNSRFTLIEANEECRPFLQATGAEHYIAVLSDKEKEVTFYTRRNSPACTGASLYRENTPFYEGDNAIENKVMATTLDRLVNNRTFDIIKIDCQGAELDILKGGIQTLSRATAVLLEVSLVEYNSGSPKKNEVFDFMLTHGFKFKEILGDITHPLNPNLTIQQDILFTRED